MKRWFALVLACVFAFCLVACNADEKNSSVGSGGSTDTIAAPLPDEAALSAEAETPATLEQENVPLSTVPAEFGEALAVHYIDVGQGDSILIELPNKQTMLIDGGNKADGTAVVNYLRDHEIGTINYLVATHPHEDHIGGLPDVIDSSIKIESIYMPKAVTTTRIFEELLTSIDNKGLLINTARSGVAVLSIPDLQIDILAPVKDNYSNLNDWSAVVKLKYKDTVFLFMGDAETRSTSEITADINADVVKIGHHGSETATNASFLKRVSPDYAIICVGEGNTYGHPHDATMAALNENGVGVFRTDEQGTIIITSDGENILANQQPVPYDPAAPPAETAPPSSTVTPPAATDPSPAQEQGMTVYVTNTGSKYHRDGCRYLSKSKIPILLEGAKLSYEPCSVCDPPQ